MNGVIPLSNSFLLVSAVCHIIAVLFRAETLTRVASVIDPVPNGSVDPLFAQICKTTERSNRVFAESSGSKLAVMALLVSRLFRGGGNPGYRKPIRRYMCYL